MRERDTGYRRRLTLSGIVCVLASLLVLAGLAMCGPISLIESAKADVCFTEAQADSVLTLIDSQRLQLRLTEIDLRESRQLARVDSTYYGMVIKKYESERDSWFERAYKHPMLWFALGAYLGVQAASN